MLVGVSQSAFSFQIISLKSVYTHRKVDNTMKLDSNKHSVFLLHYHLVLVVKYRRQVFDDTYPIMPKTFL